MDEGEDVVEEQYSTTVDCFENPSKEDQKLLIRLSYVDIKDEKERENRPLVEHHILQVSKGSRRVLSGSFYGIPLTVNDECAVLIEERFVAPSANNPTQDEQTAYMKRLEKTTTRFQVTLLVKEITSRKRLGVSPELEKLLNDVLCKAAPHRDSLPPTTNLEELAEHPNAVVRNWRILNEPRDAEVAAATKAVESVFTSESLSKFYAPAPAPPVDAKLNGGSSSEKVAAAAAAAKSKKNQKKKKKKKPVPGTEKTRLFVLRLRKQKKVRQSPGPLSWHDDRETVECLQNAQVALFENTLCVAETLESRETRVRLFKVYGLRKPLLTRTIADPRGELGVVRGVSMTKKDAFLVQFTHHVVCSINEKEPLVLSFVSRCPTAHPAFGGVEAPKEIPTAEGGGGGGGGGGGVEICSATMLENYEVAVGTKLGQVHIFDGLTGSPLQVLDLPTQLPVIRLHAHGPILYAQMQYCIVRFHPEGNLVPPYVFRSGFCAGMTGYGALMATLNECGAAWITNTFTTGVVRNIEPPEEISHLRMLTSPAPQGAGETPSIRRLNATFTQHYSAVHLTKDALYILYPCSQVVVVEFT